MQTDAADVPGGVEDGRDAMALDVALGRVRDAQVEVGRAWRNVRPSAELAHDPAPQEAVPARAASDIAFIKQFF